MVLATAVPHDLIRALLQGAPPGAAYALIAVGFVLTYKTSGVFNLAFGAQAYVSAIVYHRLHAELGWSIAPAVIVAVVLLAPALGFALEWLVFRHLRTASAAAKLIVTIGLTVALPALADIVVNLNSPVAPQGIVPNGNGVFYDVLGLYSYSRNDLAAMAVSVVAVLALGALFRWSAIGLRMRAVVESPRMTELNGIAADRVSAFAWALSSLFAGLAGVLIAPRFTALGANDFFGLVVIGVAAAAVARLDSLPRALLGGFGLGIVISIFNTFVPRWAEHLAWLQAVQNTVAPAIPFLVLLAVLLLDPKLRRSREAMDPLSGVDPPPRIPAAVGPSSRSRYPRRIAGAILGLVLVWVVFTRADQVWTYRVTEAVVLGIVFLSITVMTGYAGKISLCQGTFAAVGAFTVFQLAQRYELSVRVGTIVGAIVAGLLAAAVSLVLRRLDGIWVAIATLALAYFFDAVLVKQSWVGGVSPLQRVPRPALGPWDLTNNKAFLAVALAVLAVTAYVVFQFNRGTIGQTLRALRGSEVASQSIGISPARARVIAFATSGAIAGLGGALMAIHQGSVNYDTNFSPFATLFWLVLVVTTGASLVSGAIGAAAIFALADAILLKGAIFGWILRSPDRIPGFFPISSSWLAIGFGLATITYARHPEGSIEMVRRWWATRKTADGSPRARGDKGAHAPAQAAPVPDKAIR